MNDISTLYGSTGTSMHASSSDSTAVLMQLQQQHAAAVAVNVPFRASHLQQGMGAAAQASSFLPEQRECLALYAGIAPL